MLYLSVDPTVLSQSQREAVTNFLLNFPNPSENDELEPIRPAPTIKVQPWFYTPEEQLELTEEEKQTTDAYRAKGGSPTGA